MTYLFFHFTVPCQWVERASLFGNSVRRFTHLPTREMMRSLKIRQSLPIILKILNCRTELNLTKPRWSTPHVTEFAILSFSLTLALRYEILGICYAKALINMSQSFDWREGTSNTPTDTTACSREIVKQNLIQLSFAHLFVHCIRTHMFTNSQ